jgi:DNA-binding response OmpR family regulator
MSKGRILIIEEQPDVADMLLAYLTEKGYEVLVTRNHDEALLLARKQMPHVILISISDNDTVDGYRTVKLLRITARTSHIRIIEIVPKWLHPEGILDGWVPGIDDTITKSFDIEEVELRLKNAFDRISREKVLINGYPGRSLADDGIHDLIKSSEQCTYLDLTIQALDKYEQEYGAHQKTELWRSWHSLLDDLIEESGTMDDLLAYPVDDTFLIVSHTPDVSTLQKRLIEGFEREIGVLAPYLKLVMGVVSNSEQQFATVDEVVQLAATRRDEASQSHET